MVEKAEASNSGLLISKALKPFLCFGSWSLKQQMKICKGYVQAHESKEERKRLVCAAAPKEKNYLWELLFLSPPASPPLDSDGHVSADHASEVFAAPTKSSKEKRASKIPTPFRDSSQFSLEDCGPRDVEGNAHERGIGNQTSESKSNPLRVSGREQLPQHPAWPVPTIARGGLSPAERALVASDSCDPAKRVQHHLGSTIRSVAVERDLLPGVAGARCSLWCWQEMRPVLWSAVE